LAIVIIWLGNVISFHPNQGDHIKRLPLYKSHLVVRKEIAAILDSNKQTKSNFKNDIHRDIPTTQS
jgi:hypothetical protein